MTYSVQNFGGLANVDPVVPLVGLSGTNGYLPAGTYNISALADYNNCYSFELSFYNITNPVLIKGNVYCICDNLPIPGAIVQVGNYAVPTDTAGAYSINGIPPGTYAVTISAPNYYTTNVSVTISSNSSTMTQNFSLVRSYGLDYFGVGVNWANVTNPPGMNGVRGDIDATNIYSALQSDLSVDQYTIVPLDATESSAHNFNIIATQFNEFTARVCADDTIVFYVSSHAGPLQENGVPIIEFGVSDDFNSNNQMDSAYVANLLNSLPTSTRKIVILDGCSSGGIAISLADMVKNISILASASAYPVTVGGVFYDSTTSATSNGTGVFTDSLIDELNDGVYNLGQIIYDILVDRGQIYAALEGQNLNLKDSGTAIFTGLQPQFWEASGFTGTLASNIVTSTQSPPTVTKPTISNGSFQMTLTNLPSEGSIAIELSTNLISWLQVGFYPATGTNLTFSFLMTSNSTAFFRTAVVP